MEVLKIFEGKFHGVIKDGIKSVALEGSESAEAAEEAPKPEISREKTNSKGCSCCRVAFEDVAQQREHFKLDWHRYNLKQSLLQRSPISEEEFDEKTGKDDVSSISGSDSETEESPDAYATAQGKIFLQNTEGAVFSVHACLLYNKKEEITDEVVCNRIRECCVTCKKWAVIMLGGGHFAAAVFNGADPVLHKTFHSYTVRAGQGGSQSSRDNKNSTSHPKSAGASLRRFNEQTFVEHIKHIVEAWKSELDGCSLVFYRTPGPYNRGVLFGGSNTVFDKNDTRLRSIPFSTRRATFAEVKRVHSILTLAHVYKSSQAAAEQFARHKTNDQNCKRPKSKLTSVNRAKSRELVQRPLPVAQSSSSSGDEICCLSAENHTISFEDSLQEFDDSLTPEQRKQNRKTKKPKKSKAQKAKERDDERKNTIVEALSKGDVAQLQELLGQNQFVDEILDSGGNSLMHVAAMNEQTETVFFLLQNGANPCVKNVKQQTPYTCTRSKEVREMFKQFARDNPDRYNYNKAQIPTSVLTPDELSEKRKQQRKIKKEKEKVKKVENETKRLEEVEKVRFLKLSDREKRALAAERRIVNQTGNVITRCFACACDITGKVPFDYLGNKFCTIDCLKAHRLKNVA